MTVNLVPIPKAKGVAVVQFDSLKEALSSVPAILETVPSAIELLDNLAITLCRDVPKYARLVNDLLRWRPGLYPHY